MHVGQARIALTPRVWLENQPLHHNAFTFEANAMVRSPSSVVVHMDNARYSSALSMHRSITQTLFCANHPLKTFRNRQALEATKSNWLRPPISTQPLSAHRVQLPCNWWWGQLSDLPTPHVSGCLLDLQGYCPCIPLLSPTELQRRWGHPFLLHQKCRTQPRARVLVQSDF